MANMMESMGRSSSLDMDAANRIVRRARGLRAARLTWESLWEEIALYIYPERRGFTAELPAGSELQENVWTSQPQMAREELTNAIDAWSRPQGKYWLGLDPADPSLSDDRDVRLWCDSASKILTMLIYDPRALFEKRMAECTDDLVSFGTASMTVDVNKKGNHFVFRVHHMKDVVVAENYWGAADEVYCFWNLTLSQIVERFGEESLSQSLKDAWDSSQGNYEKKYTIVHAVMPTLLARKYGARASTNMPYASFWILEKDKHCLGEGGFLDQYYTIMRWEMVTREPYGRSPAMIVLNDVRTANAVAQALIEITEKQGNPPVQYPFDAIRGEIELFPGGATPFDMSGYQYQGDPIRPVKLGSDAPLTADFLKNLEERIGRGFFADVVNPTTLAGQVSKGDQAAMQQMSLERAGPLFAKIQDEQNGNILDRCFSLALHEGAFPPMPKKLLGKRLNWRYDTPITMMREQSSAMSSMRAIQAMGQVAPQAIQDNLDTDIVVRQLCRKLGIPEAFLRPMEQVLQARVQEKQMAQAQQMAEMAQKAAPAVKAATDAHQSGGLAQLGQLANAAQSASQSSNG